MDPAFSFRLKAFSFIVLCGVAGSAAATPSTQIWIPSTDVQKYLSVHLNLDTYVRTAEEGDTSRLPPIVMVGPTVGVSPWEKIQLELGFDAVFQGNTPLDRDPLYFHAKVGTPEGSVSWWTPALAVGIYNLGYKKNLTDQDVAYALLARTLPYLGRLSVGYYVGNDRVLRDENGAAANHGILASWDRTLTELSDKLWLAVDFQGGRNLLSSVNFGVAWAFSANMSAILGYDVYLNPDVAGQNTLTVQIDVNL